MPRGMGRGRGRMPARPAGGSGGRLGAGPGGNCVCPSCGTKVAHQVGTPCASMNCPKCGIRMARE